MLLYRYCSTEYLSKEKYPNALGRSIWVLRFRRHVTAYQSLKQRARRVKVEITLKNVNKQGLDGETYFNIYYWDEALRMYALFQNPRGRRILKCVMV